LANNTGLAGEARNTVAVRATNKASFLNKGFVFATTAFVLILMPSLFAGGPEKTVAGSGAPAWIAVVVVASLVALPVIIYLILKRSELGSKLEYIKKTYARLKGNKGGRERREIRQATSADAEKVLNFFKELQNEQLLTIFRHGKIPSLEEEKEFLEGKSGEDDVVFVCIEGSRVVGMISAERKKHPQMRHSCEFGMGVLKDYRNRNIGTELIRKLTLWAQDKKIRRLELSVFENNVLGIRLYKRLGFFEEGRKTGAIRIGDKFIDLIEMAKDIDNSQSQNRGTEYFGVGFNFIAYLLSLINKDWVEEDGSTIKYRRIGQDIVTAVKNQNQPLSLVLVDNKKVADTDLFDGDLANNTGLAGEARNTVAVRATNKASFFNIFDYVGEDNPTYYYKYKRDKQGEIKWNSLLLTHKKKTFTSRVLQMFLNLSMSLVQLLMRILGRQETTSSTTLMDRFMRKMQKMIDGENLRMQVIPVEYENLSRELSSIMLLGTLLTDHKLLSDIEEKDRAAELTVAGKVALISKASRVLRTFVQGLLLAMKRFVGLIKDRVAELTVAGAVALISKASKVLRTFVQGPVLAARRFVRRIKNRAAELTVAGEVALISKARGVLRTFVQGLLLAVKRFVEKVKDRVAELTVAGEVALISKAGEALKSMTRGFATHLNVSSIGSLITAAGFIVLAAIAWKIIPLASLAILSAFGLKALGAVGALLFAGKIITGALAIIGLFFLTQGLTIIYAFIRQGGIRGSPDKGIAYVEDGEVKTQEAFKYLPEFIQTSILKHHETVHLKGKGEVAAYLNQAVHLLPAVGIMITVGVIASFLPGISEGIKAAAGLITTNPIIFGLLGLTIISLINRLKLLYRTGDEFIGLRAKRDWLKGTFNNIVIIIKGEKAEKDYSGVVTDEVSKVKKASEQKKVEGLFKKIFVHFREHMFDPITRSDWTWFTTGTMAALGLYIGIVLGGTFGWAIVGLLAGAGAHYLGHIFSDFFAKHTENNSQRQEIGQRIKDVEAKQEKGLDLTDEEKALLELVSKVRDKVKRSYKEGKWYKKAMLTTKDKWLGFTEAFPVLGGILQFIKGRAVIFAVSGYFAGGTLDFLGYEDVLPNVLTHTILDVLPHTIPEILSITFLVIGLNLLKIISIMKSIKQKFTKKDFNLKTNHIPTILDNLGSEGYEKENVAKALKAKALDEGGIYGISDVLAKELAEDADFDFRSIDQESKFYKYNVRPTFIALGMIISSPVAAAVFFISEVKALITKQRPQRSDLMEIWLGTGENFLGSFWYMWIIGAEIKAVLEIGDSVAEVDFIKDSPFLSEYVGEPVQSAIHALESRHGAIAFGQNMLDAITKEIGTLDLTLASEIEDKMPRKDVNIYKEAIDLQAGNEDLSNLEAIEMAEKDALEVGSIAGILKRYGEKDAWEKAKDIIAEKKAQNNEIEFTEIAEDVQGTAYIANLLTEIYEDKGRDDAWKEAEEILVETVDEYKELDLSVEEIVYNAISFVITRKNLEDSLYESNPYLSDEEISQEATEAMEDLREKLAGLKKEQEGIESTDEEKDDQDKVREKEILPDNEILRLIAKYLPEGQLRNAVRIVGAESGFDINAINDTMNKDGSIDYGLFQINSQHIHKVIEMFDSRFEEADSAQISEFIESLTPQEERKLLEEILFDPDNNAKFAAYLYHERGKWDIKKGPWGDWATARKLGLLDVVYEKDDRPAPWKEATKQDRKLNTRRVLADEEKSNKRIMPVIGALNTDEDVSYFAYREGDSIIAVIADTTRSVPQEIKEAVERMMMQKGILKRDAIFEGAVLVLSDKDLASETRISEAVQNLSLALIKQAVEFHEISNTTVRFLYRKPSTKAKEKYSLVKYFTEMIEGDLLYRFDQDKLVEREQLEEKLLEEGIIAKVNEDFSEIDVPVFDQDEVISYIPGTVEVDTLGETSLGKFVRVINKEYVDPNTQETTLVELTYSNLNTVSISDSSETFPGQIIGSVNVGEDSDPLNYLRIDLKVNGKPYNLFDFFEIDLDSDNEKGIALADGSLGSKAKSESKIKFNPGVMNVDGEKKLIGSVGGSYRKGDTELGGNIYIDPTGENASFTGYANLPVSLGYGLPKLPISSYSSVFVYKYSTSADFSAILGPPALNISFKDNARFLNPPDTFRVNGNSYDTQNRMEVGVHSRSKYLDVGIEGHNDYDEDILWLYNLYGKFDTKEFDNFLKYFGSIYLRLEDITNENERKIDNFGFTYNNRQKILDIYIKFKASRNPGPQEEIKTKIDIRKGFFKKGSRSFVELSLTGRADFDSDGNMTDKKSIDGEIKVGSRRYNGSIGVKGYNSGRM